MYGHWDHVDRCEMPGPGVFSYLTMESFPVGSECLRDEDRTLNQ